MKVIINPISFSSQLLKWIKTHKPDPFQKKTFANLHVIHSSQLLKWIMFMSFDPLQKLPMHLTNSISLEHTLFWWRPTSTYSVLDFKTFCSTVATVEIQVKVPLRRF